MIQKPAFISFTGVDSDEEIDRLLELSTRYPIEWGVLIDAEQAGAPLFPNASTITSLRTSGLIRLAAHVCGTQAARIASDPLRATLSLAGFQRMQVNHGFQGSSTDQIENCLRFGRSQGVRVLLQTVSEFPEDARIDWLFDVSFGKGRQPSKWPSAAANRGFCGYSGGISPDNVESVLSRIAAPQGLQYWIDMESGVRTDGMFDLDKCEAVCKVVYPTTQRYFL